jgi:hypothetical protein
MAALSVVGGMRLFTIAQYTVTAQRFGVFILIFSTFFCVCGNLHMQTARRLPAENEADMMKSLEIVDWCDAIRGSGRLQFDCEIESVGL